MDTLQRAFIDAGIDTLSRVNYAREVTPGKKSPDASEATSRHSSRDAYPLLARLVPPGCKDPATK